MVTTAATPKAITPDEQAALGAIIEQDPNEPGRHNARFVDYSYHVWTVLGALRRMGGNIAEVAHEYGTLEEAIGAAIRYYELHRDLFDAFFLLNAEETRARTEAFGGDPSLLR